ncbi:hypothetical protein ACGFX4_15510 [Kitasatospora sp. NPDC048365]|uniref:hypothetical protein n=1 Tax=Kitasatospora sp. NPDC048365 TaxID=3364050 RepID=UPI003715C92E
MSESARYKRLRMAIVAIVGAVLMISSVPQSVDARETAHRPVLRMTISSCVTWEASGHRTVVCRGSESSRSNDFAAAKWTLTDLPKPLPGGSEVPVLCDPDGTCTSPVTGRWYLVPLGAAVFGGLLVALGLTYLAVNRRSDQLLWMSHRRFLPGMWISTGTLAALLAGGEAAYLFA